MRATPLLLTLMLFAGNARAQAPRFDIVSASVFRSQCTLVSLDESGRVVMENAGARRTLEDVIEIQQEGRPLPPLLTRRFISLTNGDRLPLTADLAATLDGRRLHVVLDPSLGLGGDKAVSFFAPNVVLLFSSVPAGVEDPERFFANLQSGARTRDVAHLQNGDRIEGTLTALSQTGGATLLIEGKKSQIPWTKLAGIALGTDRLARLKPALRYARVILENGARLNVLDFQFDESTRRWIGKTQFGSTFQVPEANVVAIDICQPSVVNLADLTPMRYEHRPFLDVAWPLAKNSAATGDPLRFAGGAYELGLGTHAACSVAYKLDGKYRRFDAVVGIDKLSPKGRARAAIELDGKRVELNAGKEFTAQTTPQVVRLDTRGIRAMTLIVDFGSTGDVQANLNWAKARLVKRNE
ncbi:MAG: hypothetical protein FJ303_11870 [Planctomycetes bacterium]|nr:hypothetical protein [Planctomycetota bacterium]